MTNDDRKSLLKQRCDLMLDAMIGHDLVASWWESRNRAFDERTPLQQWEVDYESVYNYLMRHVQR